MVIDCLIFLADSPGSTFQQIAEECKPEGSRTYQAKYKWARDRMWRAESDGFVEQDHSNLPIRWSLTTAGTKRVMDSGHHPANIPQVKPGVTITVTYENLTDEQMDAFERWAESMKISAD